MYAVPCVCSEEVNGMITKGARTFAEQSLREQKLFLMNTMRLTTNPKTESIHRAWRVNDGRTGLPAFRSRTAFGHW